MISATRKLRAVVKNHCQRVKDLQQEQSGSQIYAKQQRLGSQRNRPITHGGAVQALPPKKW